jgi:hypothetical protein
METPLDQPDDIAQRLARVMAVRDKLADFLQREEQRTFMIGKRRTHGKH